MKILKKPKAPGQARGHIDHKLTMGLAHNIARHMFTPAMPYDQLWGCGTRWKCPFIGPNSVFDKPWCKGVGGVTWRHCGVFPICLDRWKAQSVCFLNMHGRARPSHTGLERSDHYGLEVGPKNGKFFFQNQVARSTGGVTWRHREVFPICLDRWKAQSVYGSKQKNTSAIMSFLERFFPKVSPTLTGGRGSSSLASSSSPSHQRHH